MGEPTNSSTSSNDPIFDAMPEIPTFEPAPVPKPVVTDTMPPIPVTAPAPTPAPVKPAGMPVFGASQAPATAPAQAPINAAPVQRPVQNPAPVPNPVQRPVQNPAPVPNPVQTPAPAAVPNLAPTPNPATMQAPAPQAPATPQVPRFNPAVLQSNQPTQPAPRPVQQPAPQPVPAQQINPAMSAALDAAMRGETPAQQPALNMAPTPNAQPNAQPNTQPMPNAAPAMPPMPPDQPQFTNPFAEAMEKNREIRSVSFSSQDSRPIAQAPLKGGNKKRLIILGLIVVVLLLIVVAVVAAMSSKKPETPAEPAPTTPISTNTPGDYICEKTYLESEFDPFGNPVAATAKVYFTFDENGLEKIKSEQVITYDDTDAVKAAFTKLSNEHEAAYTALGLTEDPVSALYKRSGNDLKITYNATALDLTNDALKFFDVETAQVIDTITSDDMQDLYEANSYTCGTAPVETVE